MCVCVCVCVCVDLSTPRESALLTSDEIIMRTFVASEYAREGARSCGEIKCRKRWNRSAWYSHETQMYKLL